MKIPEQLPLDFASGPGRDTQREVAPTSGAQVLSLDAARTARHEQHAGELYAAIRESIKHIDLQRALRMRSSDDPPER